MYIYSMCAILCMMMHIADFTWEMGNSFAIEFVGDAHFNLIKHIKNIQFSQSNSAKKKELFFLFTQYIICV